MNQKIDWSQLAFKTTLDNINRSHSPYSNFQVGSYLLTEAGPGFLVVILKMLVTELLCVPRESPYTRLYLKDLLASKEF